MSLADYMRIVNGHRLDEFKRKHEYRNILGALCHTDPRKLFELPGDWDHVSEQLTQEEMVAQAKKLGYAHLLGIKGEC